MILIHKETAEIYLIQVAGIDDDRVLSSIALIGRVDPFKNRAVLHGNIGEQFEILGWL